MSQDNRDVNQSIMTTKSDGYSKDFKRIRRFVFVIIFFNLKVFILMYGYYRRRPGDYIPTDYKEVKMELSQSKDLLVHFYTIYNRLFIIDKTILYLRIIYFQHSDSDGKWKMKLFTI
jgi:hypothetical protein